MRPTPRPSLHCRRCGQRLLYADESAQKLRPRVVRISEGCLWVQCTTRGCGTWAPMPGRLSALLRQVLPDVPEGVGCLDSPAS